VPANQVLPVALELARKIAGNPQMAVRAIKRAVDRDDALDDEDSAAFEADLFARTWISDDHQEALAARREKRPPNFKGR
jgi:enoyl-CoA hydratase/carnithine racemase